MPCPLPTVRAVDRGPDLLDVDAHPSRPAPGHSHQVACVGQRHLRRRAALDASHRPAVLCAATTRAEPHYCLRTGLLGQDVVCELAKRGASHRLLRRHGDIVAGGPDDPDQTACGSLYFLLL